MLTLLLEDVDLQSIVEPTSHGAFALGGQMWGSLHPFEGVPPPGRAAGDQVFTYHPLLGAIFLDGPTARVGLGWAGTGWSQAWGSLAALHSRAAENEEGTRAPGGQSGFKSPLCLLKVVGP